MTDIVDSLSLPTLRELAKKALDENEALRADNERLRAVLESIKRHGELASVDAGSQFASYQGHKPPTKDVWQFPRHILNDIDEALGEPTPPA